MGTDYSFEAVIFDMDGVITKTSIVHALAWKTMFDEFLTNWSKRNGVEFEEFDQPNDYLAYVDGKPRIEGIRSFLKSREIGIPFGTPSDLPGQETIWGLGNRKNLLFNEIVKSDGVGVYKSTVELIRKLRAEGIKTGVASSSKNCLPILEAANLLPLFDTRVDGTTLDELGLKGKPDPDIFQTACDNLNVPYSKTIIMEDAVSGVQAGAKGNFGLTIGIARENNAIELAENGANFVVEDLNEISELSQLNELFNSIH